MHVKVNGTRLFFDVVGSSLLPTEQEMQPKPTLIVLHGGPGMDHSYLRPLDALGDVAQVIYLDLRGQGRSARHHQDYYQLGIMADDVAAFCADLSIEHPVVLGQSFGGFVALTLALRHPELLGGLILGSTSPRGDFTFDLELLEQLADKDRREFAARFAASEQASEEDMRRFNEELLPLYSYPPATPERLAGILSRTIFNQELAEYMGVKINKEYDVRPQLTSILVPTLVLHGSYDWVIPLREAEELAQTIPHARLHIFEQRGHGVHGDAPEAYTQVIRTFLAEALRKEPSSLAVE
jgi:proline-specific peptidase